jgi:hypothetical protein
VNAPAARATRHSAHVADYERLNIVSLATVDAR